MKGHGEIVDIHSLGNHGAKLAADFGITGIFMDSQIK